MLTKGKRGFTIVELLMVIGVLGILVGLITTAASTAMRQARTRRTAAMQAILQTGLETYHAQLGKWPDVLQQRVDAGMGAHRLTKAVYLGDDDADKVFQQLVEVSVKPGGSPMLDVTGLLVARKSSVNYNAKSKSQGIDFSMAIVNSKHRKKILRKEMAFGYLTRSDGVFRRFVVKYNFETDSVSVLTQNESGSPNDFHVEMVRLAEALGDKKYKDISWPNCPND